MKNIWKWVLGIVVVLIVAAGLFGLGFIHQTRMMANIARSSAVQPQSGRGPIMRGGFPGGARPRMMEMRNFGRGPGRGGMFFGIFGRLIPLALGLLLLYGVYRLGMRHNTPVTAPVAPAPPAAVTTNHPCPRCGSAVQDGWNHCPNCGEKQT